MITIDDATNEFLLDQYKNSEAIRRINKAMDDIWSVVLLLDLKDAENDLRHGLACASIELDQIVMPQLQDGVTKGVWS